MMQEITEGPVLLSCLSDHVALVTLNRPEARNAVSKEVANTLEKIVRTIDDDRTIRSVVLTGAGDKVFCAGADLKEVASGKLDDLMRPETGFAGFVNHRRRTPWIAAVEGLALAGGCEIALACDMIVASKGGAFGLPEVTRGLIASAGGVYRLPRAIPKAVAIELILTADRLSSERAAELGMVNHLVGAGETVDRAFDIAKKIASNAPIAVAESLNIAKLSADLGDVELQKLSEEAQARVTQTADFVEGPKAFIEKRPPRWLGA